MISLEKLYELINPRHMQYVDIDWQQVLCISKTGVREFLEMEVVGQPEGSEAH